MMRVRAGQVIGRDHMLRQANAQDSYTVMERDGHVIGVVCDGCGGGEHSEVGATLAAQYIAGQVAEMIGSGVTLDNIPGELYGRTVRFLDYLTVGMQPANRTAFIQHYLLFTVVGVIANEHEAVIFSAGDGLVVVDDTVTKIDQSNTPAYIAYRLLDEEQIGGFDMPDGFDVCRLAAWARLAVASDGFEVELLPEVWGITHSRGLQRKLNMWSNMGRRFQDDATIITVERVDDAERSDQREDGTAE